MSQWTKEKVQHIACKATPSYLLNNLAYNGTHFAFVHTNEVLLVPDVGKKSTSTEKIITKDGAQVTQAKWVNGVKSTGHKDLLVVATYTNFQVYDSDARMLFSFALPNGPEGKQKFARGITTSQASGKTFLLVGTSSGSVLAFEAKAKDYTFSQVLKAHAYPLCELTSDMTHGSGAWASGDSYGNVVSWNGLEKDATFAGTGYPCTTLALRGATLICGYANGLITIFNLKTRAKVAEIAAHSRAINAIDLHPTLDTFVSVSDDSYVNVWAINTSTFEVKHVFATSVTDNLLCGVQFAGDKYNNIAVSAFDYPQLFVFTS